MPGRLPTPLPVTPLTPAVTDWLAWLEGGHTDKTITQYVSVVRRLLEWKPDLSADDLDDTHGEKLLTLFLNETFGQRSYSTRRSARATLMTLTKFLRRHHHIGIDPGPELPRVKADPPKPEPLPIVDVQRIIAAQEDPRDRLAIILMARLAFRKNEVRLLQYKHFRPELGYIDLLGAKGGHAKRQTIGSTAIRLAVEAVIQEFGANPDDYLLCPRHVSGLAWIKGQTFERPSVPRSESGMTTWWLQCLNRADYPRVRMHRLRHTAATAFWNDTHDVVALTKFGRWAGPQVPLSVYVAADLSTVVDGIQNADDTWK